jgi:uncharacterized membrane protein
MDIWIALAVIFGSFIPIAIVAFAFWGLIVKLTPKANWSRVSTMLLGSAIVFPSFAVIVQLWRWLVAPSGSVAPESTGLLAVVLTPTWVLGVIMVNSWALHWWTKDNSGGAR